MRLIGHLATETAARTLGDYLYSQQIDNHIEFEKDGGWAIWINDEDKIAEATTILKEFDRDPQHTKYRAGAKQASQRRAEEAHKQEEYHKRVRDITSVARPFTEYGFGPVVVSFMLISAVIFVLTKFGTERGVVSFLFMSDYINAGLVEIRHGQIWRLFTPMFIHFDPLHILFNLLWLRDLGGMIELRLGSWRLLLMALGLATVSNLVQYFLAGPGFGGMSGVVYGLLGYVWMRSKFDPASGFFLHPITVAMMLVWLLLGFSGFMNMANGAHGGGLVMGMVWGYLASRRAA